MHCSGRLTPPQMARVVSRAPSIYALPARYEPFGLSVLEAALSGCALVLGDIPSLREIWDGAALFVDPDDARRAAKHAADADRGPRDLPRARWPRRARAAGLRLRRTAWRTLTWRYTGRLLERTSLAISARG